MNKQIDILKATRKNVLTVLEPFSVDQLNCIPHHFRNNLIWNAGHILASQQLLLYNRSGLEPRIPSEIIEKYRRGTIPTEKVDISEISTLKELLLQTVEKLKEDLEKGLFKEYQPYTTKYGFHLGNNEDALIFNNVHESMHLGYMLALRKEL